MAAPALRRIPRLHAVLFFTCLATPLAGVWWAARAGAPPAMVLVLALAAVSLASFASLPVGGLAQALAAAGARQMWERRAGGLRSAWRDVRPHLGSLVWRGLGDEGLFGGRDVADWVYADRAAEAPPARHHLYGRLTALTVVLGSLLLGLPVALLLVEVVGGGADPASELASSFLLGIAVSFALAVYSGGALGILGAVVAAAEHHEATYHQPPPGFPATRDVRRTPAAPKARFQRI